MGFGNTAQSGCLPSATALPNRPPAMMSKPRSLVLLIEGEPKTRSFLRSGFEIHGFSVAEAENAADGLKIAAFNLPNLVILDLGLPDLHGSEVLERLRSWFRLSSCLPNQTKMRWSVCCGRAPTTMW